MNTVINTKNKVALASVLFAGLALPMLAFAGEKHHEQEVKGVVQVMPAKKIGLWKIQGQQVKVTASTRIDEKECALKVGQQAEAEGAFSGKLLVATKIECEMPDDKDKKDPKDND